MDGDVALVHGRTADYEYLLTRFNRLDGLRSASVVVMKKPDERRWPVDAAPLVYTSLSTTG